MSSIISINDSFGEYIYHYTTVKALFGILKNKEFWWGNTSSMNDRRERLEFVGRIKETVTVDFAQTAPERTEEFCRHIEEEARAEFPFAMCFSSQEEDASQWERYADKAYGVCLKIRTSALAKILSGCNVVFNNVYYDFDIRNHRYYPLLREYLEKGTITDTEGIFDLESLVSNILASAPSYKNHSFWAECERRVYTLIGMPFSADGNIFRIGYEAKDNEIKRYLKIRYDMLCSKCGVDVDELFEEVVIGPRSEQNREELRAFCSDMGFPKLSGNIRNSNCPLR